MILISVYVQGERNPVSINILEIQAIKTLKTHTLSPNEIEVEMKNGVKYIVLEKNEETLKNRINEASKK